MNSRASMVRGGSSAGQTEVVFGGVAGLRRWKEYTTGHVLSLARSRDSNSGGLLHPRGQLLHSDNCKFLQDFGLRVSSSLL